MTNDEPMTNDELIRWGAIHGQITEDELREALSCIETFCVENDISMFDRIKILVDLSNAGIRASLAGKRLREIISEMSNTKEYHGT